MYMKLYDYLMKKLHMSKEAFGLDARIRSNEVMFSIFSGGWGGVD